MDDQPDDFDFSLRHPIPAVEEVKNLPVPYKPAHEDIDFEAGLNEIESHYHRVCAALPPGYEFDQSRNLIVCKKDGSKRAKAICSSLAILAFLPPAGRSDAMLEVQFLDEDAQVVAMQIPCSDLASSYPAAIAMLRNRGLYMPATTRDMAEFLRAFRPRIKRLPEVVNGWSPDDRLIFGLQDKRIVATAGTPLSSHLTAFIYEGDKLRRWKAEVAAKFSGSSIPLFFLCAAFAGPILDFLHLPTFALNVVIMTSRGKTTLLETVAKVWPATKVNGWDMTRVAAQDLCVAANSTLLVLDEAPMKKPVELVELIMQITNGHTHNARSQFGVSAAEAHVLKWAMPVLCSSERSLRSVMATNKKAEGLPEGALARFVDVVAPDRKGEIWTELHGTGSRFTLLQQITRASKEDEGIAGPSFVKAMLNNRIRLNAHCRSSRRRPWLKFCLPCSFRKRRHQEKSCGS